MGKTLVSFWPGLLTRAVKQQKNNDLIKILNLMLADDFEIQIGNLNANIHICKSFGIMHFLSAQAHLNCDKLICIDLNWAQLPFNKSNHVLTLNGVYCPIFNIRQKSLMGGCQILGAKEFLVKSSHSKIENEPETVQIICNILKEDLI